MAANSETSVLRGRFVAELNITTLSLSWALFQLQTATTNADNIGLT